MTKFPDEFYSWLRSKYGWPTAAYEMHGQFTPLAATFERLASRNHMELQMRIALIPAKKTGTS